MRSRSDAETLSGLEQRTWEAEGGGRFDVEFTVDNVRFFAGAARVIEGKAAGEYIATQPRWSGASPPGLSGRSRPGTTR